MFIDLVYAAHRRQIARAPCPSYSMSSVKRLTKGYGYAGDQSENRAQNRAINYIRRNIQKLRNEGSALLVVSNLRMEPDVSGGQNII